MNTDTVQRVRPRIRVRDVPASAWYVVAHTMARDVMKYPQDKRPWISGLEYTHRTTKHGVHLRVYAPRNSGRRQWMQALKEFRQGQDNVTAFTVYLCPPGSIRTQRDHARCVYGMASLMM